MFKLFIGGVDVTEQYVFGSFKKTEQLKNRSNKASFVLNDYRVISNLFVNIRDVAEILETATSGTNVLNVSDTYEKTTKFYAGQTITVNINNTDQRNYVIESVDHNNKTITLTENLFFDVNAGTYVGIQLFGGITLKAPEEEVSKSDDFQQKVSCVDYKKLLDRENVAESFLDMYPREIFGRCIYEFAANDTEQEIDRMEDPRTNGGTAGVMTQEPIDRIFGNYSLRASISAGTGYREKTYSSFDMSVFSDFRFRWKSELGQGENIQSFVVKLGSDSSNYFEYNVPRVGTDFEDCRNYESVKIYQMAATIGTPSLSNITFVRFEMVATGNVSDVLFDQIVVSTGGFTLMNTIRGTIKLVDIRIRQKKISETFEQITRLNQEGRYVGYDRDIAYYTKLERPDANIQITETNKEFGSLLITPDTSNLRNRQLVIGGEAIEPILYTQEHESDGKEESYRLDYKFDELRIFIDVGNTGKFVEKTVGIENLNPPEDFDFLANFQEKIIRLGSAPTAIKPAKGDIVKYTYFPYKSITYRYQDSTSVAKMQQLTGGNGVYDGEVIIDRSIMTQEEAYFRAKAEVDEFKNPLIDCTFMTNKDNITVGELVTVSDSNRDIDDKYLIQKATCKHIGDSFFEYKITAATTLFGITEFLQMLLRRASNLYLDEDSVVFIAINQDETISLQDAVETFVKGNEFQAGTITKKTRDFLSLSGNYTNAGVMEMHKNQRNIAYTDQDGEVDFDATTDHNNGKCMQLTTNQFGDTSEMVVFDRIIRPMKSDKEYVLAYRIETISLTGQGASPDFFVQLQEYDSGNNIVATHQISSGVDVKDFKYYNLQFTTQNNTVGYRISVIVQAAAGVFQVADIKLAQTDAFVQSNPAIADFSETS